MSEISNAIKQICQEKGLSYEAVLATIEAALAAAYRKDFGSKMQNIKVNFNPEDASLQVFDVKTVVPNLPTDQELEELDDSKAEKGKQTKKDENGLSSSKEEKENHSSPEHRFNPRTEIQLADALLIKPEAKIGDEIKMKLEVSGEFGRMAAQTAKQVIIQKLHEAERNMIYEEFKNKEHEVVSGVVQRREGRIVLVDLGKTVGILPPEEQIMSENYSTGMRLKVYIKSVEMGSRGPEITLSRTSEEILKKVFYLEIPEIANGLIEIKAVAREAGSRSKVAVASEYDNVDPIGSCVGQRGSRIQTIINELGGEKIDIIEYSAEPQKFINNALSPAKILNMEINQTEKQATVIVSPDQFSLAIGKNGQNVRLAAQLTGWKIDITELKEKKDSVETKNKDNKEENKTEKNGGETDNKEENKTEKSGKKQVNDELTKEKKQQTNPSDNQTNKDKKTETETKKGQQN